ncbi:glycoside hydrolase family 30 beta sandwich domain-containing protein [Paenibacillus sp. JX-17]|uniref:Glycoside hydrolase family 30 beta sandwich domain-containing protein n=1 Tax=Paenibacillus lacisoli TaxID=3064525 RepID=A0ABT9CG77_9BACL|nr:glycoside hydrolase family 30 beta sandwich domain-containing protein [Paenibacillus sp. JX-17]MDO7907644.1 glycoside hydrolase family 30 beta sandwich domain-containing protein [Paenibacillus sp. JX-17]
MSQQQRNDKKKGWAGLIILVLVLLAGAAYLRLQGSPDRVKPEKAGEQPESKQETPAREPVKVNAWLTTGDQKSLLAEQPPITAGEQLSSAATGQTTLIRVNPEVRYQTMEGFGAAATGSSAYLINHKLSGPQRSALLKELFTPAGINLSHLRHSIGASDYSVDDRGNPASYTYDDVDSGTDYDLQHFSVERDHDVITLLRDAILLHPGLRVTGTPWTAPPWMKFGEQIYNGWYLNYEDSRVYEAYARYFVRYIQAYEEQGVPVDAITLQNEPEFTTPDYPSMSMGAQEQAMFIRDYLGPALKSSGLTVRILAYDHNWDKGPAYVNQVLSSRETADQVAGTAYHCYAGNPQVMSKVHEAYPDHSIHLTECSGGGWSPDFGDNLIWQMSNLIIDGTRNWAQSVQLWNLALDPDSGPVNGGCTNCRGVLTIDPDTGKITRNVEYYVLGHASKFIQAGAARVQSTSDVNGLKTAAFVNPDGEKVLIVLNRAASERHLTVHSERDRFNYRLPARSVVTLTWP